ncbi:MAG: beta-galactosidase [Armatimonadota bacterium]
MSRAAIVFAVLAALSAPLSARAEEPLGLVNPGFEEAEGEAVGIPAPDWEQEGAPPGWSVWYSQLARASAAEVAVTAAVAHSGGRAVSVRSARGPLVVMQQVAVEPGGLYALRAWARTTTPTSTTRLAARWRSDDGSWANNVSPGIDLAADAAAGQWHELELIVEVPENAAFLVIMLSGADQGAQDACWFDDVSVARLTGEDLYVGPTSWLHSMLHPVAEQIVTPHVAWARPRAGGPLSVLFLLGNDHNIREAQELAQRLEMDYDVAYTHDFGGLPYALNDRQIRQKYADGAYDVIVVATGTTEALAEPLRRYAERGRGVVLVGWPGMQPALPETELQPVADDHYLAEALDAFPEPPEGLETPLLESLAAAEVEGGGRVASIRWGTRCRCLTPQVSYAQHLQMPHNYWEAFLATLARGVIWAAAREPAATMDLWAEGDLATIRVTAGDKAVAGHIEWLQWTESGAGPVAITDGAPTFDLQAGQSAEREVRVSAVEAGPSFCVAILRDRAGAVIDFACTLAHSPTQTRIRSVTLGADWYAPGQAAAATFEVEPAGADGLSVNARLVDAFGRELWRGEAAIEGTQAELSVPIGEPLTTAHWLWGELTDGARTYDVARAPVLVPLPPTDYFDDWRISTWGSGNAMPAYLDMAFCDALRATGISSQLVGVDAMLASVAGRQRPVGYGYGLVGTGPYEGESKVREPCFSDPVVRERNLAAGAEAAAAQRAYGPIAAYLRDETSLVNGTLEVCSCPYCAERYRAWLRQRYGTIEALNQAWGTDYADFTEPGFVTDEQTRPASTWAPWVEFRRFMDWYWAESVEMIRSGIRQGDALIPVAYPNTFGPNPFCGRDYWLLAQVSDYSFEYVNEKRGSELGSAHRYHYEAFRCFNPDIPHLPWIGYVFEPEAIEFAPWWCALHGSSGVTIYGSMSNFAGNNSWAVLYPDLRPTRRGALYEAVTRDLREGLGKLLMSAQERSAHIAILWSQPSMYVGWMLSDAEGYAQAGSDPSDPYGARALSQAAWMRLVTGSGRQYEFVCEEQMPTGLGEFDCLVLPGAYALDGRVVEAARELLARGGTVIADLGIGLANEVGRPGARDEVVAELFGFRYAARPTWTEREILLPGAAGPQTAFGSAQIELAGGQVLAAADGEPLLLRRDHAGGGRAYYLNFATPRSNEMLAWVEREPFGALPRIAAFGHQPAEPGEYELVELRDGPMRLLGVLRDHRFGRSEGPMRLRLPTAAEVYDVRAGQRLGRTDTLTADLRPGQAAVYALLPYRVEHVELDAAASAQRGEAWALTARIKASAPTPGDHVLRIEVLDPAGKLSEAYTRTVVAERGVAQINVPFALNDAPGVWQVRVRDVATGVQSGITVTLAAA